jgi:hypothetical protein
MQKNNHTDFILSPITNVLRDVVTASAGIGSGIETYPLCDYVMQSVFLKMTGFQEQKMKCVAWEMATNDYEYRRVLLANDDNLGECSSYPDKNRIYKRLVAKINKHNSSFNVATEIDNTQILQETISDIKITFLNTNLSIWAQKSFIEFINSRTLIQHHHFANNNTNLFENILQDKYTMLYKHRNRSAHNTQSYQQNLPTLKTLVDENYKYDNYFIRFALLILVDKIFIELYKTYLDVLENNL